MTMIQPVPEVFGIGGFEIHVFLERVVDLRLIRKMV
jgi:hypothetical protein